MEYCSYVISINAIDRTVNLGTMRTIDDTGKQEISYPNVVELEDGIILCSAPMMSSKGEIVKQRCFICTNNDIVEMEGIGFIAMNSEKEAINYMKKLQGMIEWERF